jgi:hypothetical protein
MHWKARQKLVFIGAPLALVPALAFLPMLAYLVITPTLQHSTLLAAIFFAIFGVCEGLGLVRLVRCCVYLIGIIRDWTFLEGSKLWTLALAHFGGV